MTTEQAQAPVRGRGRPPRISREQILEAATDVSKEVGLAELRMSTVAERLGVRPSALNYYFNDRAELVEAVASSQLDWPAPADWDPGPEADWKEWARSIANGARRAYLSQSELAAHIRPSLGDMAGSLDTVEQFLAVLKDAGFDQAGIARAPVFLVQVVFSSVEAELRGQLPGAAAARESLVATAPADELPNLHAFFQAGGFGDWDAQFHFNVEAAIDGLAAHLDRVSARSASTGSRLRTGRRRS